MLGLVTVIVMFDVGNEYVSVIVSLKSSVDKSLEGSQRGNCEHNPPPTSNLNF